MGSDLDDQWIDHLYCDNCTNRQVVLPSPSCNVRSIGNKNFFPSIALIFSGNSHQMRYCKLDKTGERNVLIRVLE